MGEVYAAGEGFLGHGYGSDRVETMFSNIYTPRSFSFGWTDSNKRKFTFSNRSVSSFNPAFEVWLLSGVLWF